MDAFGRFAIPDVASGDIDEKKFPRVREATPMHVVQEAGDAIFVPSGWYHQVTNLEDTMSINHNWFNGYNVQELWGFFQREYTAVEAELEDLKELGLDGREFRDQCQVVMNANTGINYVEFRALLAAKERDLSARLATNGDNSISDAQRAVVLEHLGTVRLLEHLHNFRWRRMQSDVLLTCWSVSDSPHSTRTRRVFRLGVGPRRSISHAVLRLRCCQDPASSPKGRPGQMKHHSLIEGASACAPMAGHTREQLQESTGLARSTYASHSSNRVHR